MHLPLLFNKLVLSTRIKHLSKYKKNFLEENEKTSICLPTERVSVRSCKKQFGVKEIIEPISNQTQI